MLLKLIVFSPKIDEVLNIRKSNIYIMYVFKLKYSVNLKIINFFEINLKRFKFIISWSLINI